jgi:hypothetical protein
MIQTLIQFLRIVIAVVAGFVIGWCVFFVLHVRVLPPGLLVPVCMALVWWALPRFAPRFKRVSSHRGPPLAVTTEAEWTVIAARPSPLPRRGPVLAVLIPVPVAIALGSAGNVAVGLGIWAVGAGLIFALMNHGNRTKRHATLGPFAVKSDAVRLPDGQVISRQQIYRFGIRNTEDNRVFFYGGNSIQRAGQAGAAMTHARMVPISHAVVIEHGGSMSYLAGGLTQELAHAVLDEITRHVRGFAVT